MKRKSVTAVVPTPSPKRQLRTRQSRNGENIDPEKKTADNVSLNNDQVINTVTDSPPIGTPKSKGSCKALTKDRHGHDMSPYLGLEWNLNSIKTDKEHREHKTGPKTPSQITDGEMAKADCETGVDRPANADISIDNNGEDTTEPHFQQTPETESSGVSLNDTYITLSTANSSVSGEPSQRFDTSSHNTCSESEYIYLTDSSVESVTGSTNSRDGFIDRGSETAKQQCQNSDARYSVRSLVPHETDSSLDYEDSLSEDASSGSRNGNITVMQSDLYGTDGEDDTVERSETCSPSQQTLTPTDEGGSSPDTVDTPSPGPATPSPCPATASPDPTSPSPGPATPLPGSATPLPGSATPLPGSATPLPGPASPSSSPATPCNPDNNRSRESLTVLEQACLPDIKKEIYETETGVADSTDSEHSTTNTREELPVRNAVDQLIQDTVDQEQGVQSDVPETPQGSTETRSPPNMPEERTEYERQFGRYTGDRDMATVVTTQYGPAATDPHQKGNPHPDLRMEEHMYPDVTVYEDEQTMRPYPGQLGEAGYRALGQQEQGGAYSEVAGTMSPGTADEAMRLALASELVQTYSGKNSDKISEILTRESGGQFEYGAYGSRHLDDIHGHYAADYRYAQPGQPGQPGQSDVLNTPQQRPINDLTFDPKASSTPELHRRKSYSPDSSQGSYTYNDSHQHGGSWSAGGYGGVNPSDPRLRPQEKHSIYHSPQLGPRHLQMESQALLDPRHPDSLYYPELPNPATPRFYKPVSDHQGAGYYPRSQLPHDVTRMTFTPRSLMQSHLNGTHLQNIAPYPDTRHDSSFTIAQTGQHYPDGQRIAEMDYSSIYPSREFIERNSGSTPQQIRQPTRYTPKAKRKPKQTPKMDKCECTTPEEKDTEPFEPQHKYYVVNPSDATNMEPKTLISKYIDFLILENEQMTEISKSVTAPVDIYVTEDMYFMDTLKIRRCFPSKKFQEWSSSFYPKLSLEKMKIMVDSDSSAMDGEEDARPTQQVLEDVFYFFQREVINMERE